MNNSSSDTARPAKSATASAQLRAEIERQNNSAYGTGGTTGSLAKNVGNSTKQHGPSQT